jgi:polysaccharide export outer membrane protein
MTRLIAASALLLAATAFAQDTGTPPPATPSTAPAGEVTPAPNDNYVLRSQDVVDVKIHQEEDLNRVLRIDANGRIFLPLIGNVQAAGRTVAEVEAEVRALYDRDFLVNPQVNLSVIEYARRTVSILGSVNAPGLIEIPPEQNLTLLQAIARAGGFNRLARPTRVILTRMQADGTTVTRTINAQDLLNGTSSEQILLQDGDVVNVPEGIV